MPAHGLDGASRLRFLNGAASQYSGAKPLIATGAMLASFLVIPSAAMSSSLAAIRRQTRRSALGNIHEANFLDFAGLPGCLRR